MKRVKSLVHQIDPHVVDVWTISVIATAFGAAVFLITWQSSLLRLDVEGLNVAWVALVSFGMAWYAGWGTGLRIGAGIAFGLLASLAAFYGSMSVLPATKLGVGIGLAIGAAATAAVCHVVQRMASFAAAAVGYGTGLVLARAFPIRPTTPADDLFALMTAAVLAVLIGALGSLVLRGVVVRAGKTQRLGRFIPVVHFGDDEPPVTRSPNGGRRTTPMKPNGKRAAPSRSA